MDTTKEYKEYLNNSDSIDIQISNFIIALLNLDPNSFYVYKIEGHSYHFIKIKNKHHDNFMLNIIVGESYDACGDSDIGLKYKGLFNDVISVYFEYYKKLTPNETIIPEIEKDICNKTLPLADDIIYLNENIINDEKDSAIYSDENNSIFGCKQIYCLTDFNFEYLILSTYVYIHNNINLDKDDVLFLKKHFDLEKDPRIEFDFYAGKRPSLIHLNNLKDENIILDELLDFKNNKLTNKSKDNIRSYSKMKKASQPYTNDYFIYKKFSDEFEVKHRETLLDILNINKENYYISFLAWTQITIESKYFEEFSYRIFFEDKFDTLINTEVKAENLITIKNDYYSLKHQNDFEEIDLINKESYLNKILNNLKNEHNNHLNYFKDIIFSNDEVLRNEKDSGINDNLESYYEFFSRKEICYHSDLNYDYLTLAAYFKFHHNVKLNKDDLLYLLKPYKLNLFGNMTFNNFSEKNNKIESFVIIEDGNLSKESKELINLNCKV